MLADALLHIWHVEEGDRFFMSYTIFALSFLMQTYEIMRYVWRAGSSFPEAERRRETLTGPGVGINHATAVSIAGASRV